MGKKQEDMTVQEKRDARFERWASPKDPEGNDFPFESPDAKKEYQTKIKRFRDVIELKKPDRVPILIMATFMPANLYGVKPKDCMYDTDIWHDTFTKYMVDYAPDYYVTPAFVGNGRVFEILDYKQLQWPGHGISDDASGYQYLEGEYMTVDEYQAFIDDPSDFWLRTYMPRIFGALEPLKMIAPFTDIWEPALVSAAMIPLGIPPVQNALKALMDAGQEAFSWIQKIGAIEASVMGKGFVNCAGGATKAPFDMLADTLRGSRGIMMDMYRNPDLLLNAIEKITPLNIKSGVGGATAQNNPVVFLPLHRGADGFMSDEQFRTFYWPSLKAVITGIINEGCIAALFCEGSYNTRLKYLAELPVGSLWIFDRTDMAKAKETVGGNLTIAGNVPSGMIITGTADQVKDYCKNLIDVVGKDGGYMMANGTGMDEGKADTVHAMVDFTKEYGVYK